MSQIAAPTHVVHRRYWEVAPDQFSEIAFLMGDVPEVPDVVIQWCPYTNDLYRGIKIIHEDHRSGYALCYPLLFPYGTGGWTSQQVLRIFNVLEIQYGQVVDFERLEVQDRGTTHMITPKEFYNYRLLSRHGSSRSIIFFVVDFKSVWWFASLQEECGTQFEIFEAEPTKSQGAQF
jgi:hypothetical protein